MYELIKPKQGEPLYFNRGKYLANHANSKKAFHHQERRVVYQRYAAIDNYRRLIATILPQNHFCSHTVGYLQNIKPNYRLAFLLALLNSTVLDWRFNLTSTNNNINGYEIEALPIPVISFTTPAEERARLGAQLQDLYAQEKHAEILAAVNDCLPQDEAGGFIAGSERSDVVHDLLAYLAEQMLEMNKAKQQEIRGFLGWLEGYLGAKVEDLSLKTKVQGYYEHDYESLLAVLKKNRKKLAIDPDRREPGETLQAEFEGSMKKLLPLLERIRQTDELIDAVVCRLYGLTEEEIGIVEGRERDS